MSLPPTEISARCPIRTSLEMLGGKWRLVIIHQLREGPRRFSDLSRLIPDISEKMLAQELKSLVENHLVDRREDAPSGRVTYALTAEGRLALPLIEALARFARAYEKAFA